MTNKKNNRYKNRQEHNHPTPKNEIDEESLLKECL